jgi:hypothetical protein
MLMTQEGKHRLILILASLSYLMAVSIFLYLLFAGWAYDDPFITYRYASNLAHGLGFVYNPGQRIQSTTTPLFALLLAPISYSGADLPHLANLIGAFSLVLGGLVLWDLARTWETPFAGWVSLLLFPTFALLITTLGSETPLYLAFCLGAFTFYARRQYVVTALLAALAVLTRPDGVLVAIVLSVDFILSFRNNMLIPWRNPTRLVRELRKQRLPIPWKAVFLFGGITLAWFIFAWLYFGSPLPVTLVVKQQQGSMAISERFAPGFIGLVQSYAQSWQYWLYAALAFLGISLLFSKARRWNLLVAWTLFYFLAYSILGVSRYYWYYAPLVPAFVVLMGLGLSAITGQFSKVSKRFSWVPAVVILPLLAFGQGRLLLGLREYHDSRVAIYQATGIWLNGHTPRDAKIGTLEVGIIGYYAQRPMIDFAGLIQPEVSKHLTDDTTYQDSAIWAVQHYQPDYLVLPKGDFPELENGFAAQNCTVVKSFSGKKFKYKSNLLIYACQYNS